MAVLRTKSIEQSIRDTEEPDHQLRKDLSAWDLTVFGIGAVALIGGVRRSRGRTPTQGEELEGHSCGHLSQVVAWRG